MPDHLSFTDDFPIPDLDAWIDKATRDLRGRSLDELGWESGVGEPLSPLATAADTENLPHLGPTARTWFGAGTPWRSRELIVAARPEDAARHARAALDDGIDEIELCFDDLARDAREPGDHGESPGVSGIAIHEFGAFRAALSGVDLANTTIGISAGECAGTALAYLACLADERGVARDALRGDLDFDPIARLTQRQAGIDEADESVVVSTRASVGSVFDETTNIVKTCAAQFPGLRALSIDGQGFHLAGATAARELGCTLATLVTVARELTARGCSIEEIAAATTVRMQVSHETLLEVAKLRALRLLWARVMHMFGAQETQHLQVHLQAVTSGRSRSYRFDLRTNLLRTTLAAFAAIVGGSDVVTIVPFDEDPAEQDDAMRRLARHHHHLLRHESHLDDVQDPGAGSFVLERLTDRLARAAWSELQEIERGGGLLEAFANGDLFERVSGDAEIRTRAFAQGDRTLVGINRYVDAQLEGGGKSDPTEFEHVVDELATRHAEFLSQRGEVNTSASASAFDDACESARAGATSGEIARATWPADETFRHRFLPIALLDGDEFEDLREENLDAPRRVILARLDDDKATRKQAALGRSALTAGGFAIEESGPATIDQIRDKARELSADAIVVCGNAEPDRLRELITRGRRLAIVGQPDADLERRGVVFWHDGTDWIDALHALLGGHDVA